MSDTATRPIVAPPTDDPKPERRRRRPRIRVKYLIFAVMLVSAIGVLAWLLSWQSPVPIREVTVSGAEPEKQVEVLAAAGIQVGTPINELDTQAITQRVQDLPGIDGTALVLERPWTVVIDVLERFPFAVVPAGEEWTVVDATGAAIRGVSQKPERLPQVDAAPQDLGTAVTVVSALPEEFRSKIKSVAVDPSGQVIISLKSGTKIVWGSAADSALKATALQALLPLNAKTINVSVPQRPALVGDLDLPKENRPTPSEDPTVQ